MKESKTPKFDALMNEVLNKLVPHEKVCVDCKKDFKIEAGDITFYKMFRVPPPKLCSNCRLRRRLSCVNYSSIYKRKCDVSGHTDIMISLVAPIMPWITYDYETYHSDKWDPFSYGKKIKPDESFFNQFLELLKIIPQPGIRKGANSLNSDYCFYGENLKDGYYVFGGRRSENILFSTSIYDSKNIFDSYFVRDVDTGFDNVTTSDCYKCFFAYFSSNCLNCNFIYDCRNCQNCFGCVNLRNKNYCWFNEQFTKEEYLKKLASVDLGSIKKTKEYKNKFWSFVKENPVRAVRNHQSVNVSGNDIKRSKNCQHVFQTEDSENVRYASFVIFRMRDSMDIGFSGGAERNYEAQNVSGNSSNVKFSLSVKESIDCEYIMNCKNCTHCFGCVGLKNVSYAIFNRKYEPKDYWGKLDEIKTKMLQDGDYGEFFPMSFAPVAYNSSMANIIYPMTETEAKERGLFWQPDTDTDTKNLKTIKIDELPDNVNDATEELCNVAIIGEISRKPFRLTSREINFYKQNKLSLPTDTPQQRMLDRFKILNNFQVYKENCFSCNDEIESSYRQSDGYRPVCEECYQKEIL